MTHVLTAETPHGSESTERDTVQVIDLRASRKALITGTVGHLIEWYEFAVYGYMGPYAVSRET